MLREDKALVHTINLPISHASACKTLEARAHIGNKTSTSIDLPFSNEGKRVLAYAAEEAERLDHRHIGAEHFLLGLLREAGCFAAVMLREAGANLEILRSKIAELPVPWNESHVSPGELPFTFMGGPGEKVMWNAQPLNRNDSSGKRSRLGPHISFFVAVMAPFLPT